jgi:hypothetical protein
MSAAEIIEQIKALPPDEQREVSRFVRNLTEPDTSAPGIRYATDEEARAAGDAVVAEFPETFRRLAE